MAIPSGAGATSGLSSGSGVPSGTPDNGSGFDANGMRVKKRGPGLGSPWLGTSNQPAGAAPGAQPLGPNANAFTGLQVNNLTNQSVQAVGDMVSGAANAPFRTAANESFSRAATNLRAQTGGYNAPNVGQGAAVQAQQGVEQSIMTGMSENQLAQDQAEQATKERGVNAFQGLSSEIRAQNTDTETQWTKGWDQALLYNDPSTPEGLGRLQDMYEQKYGYRPDFNQLKEQRDYARSKQEQDVTTGGLTIQSMTNALGDQKFNSIMQRINAGATIDQLQSEFPDANLTPDQYGSMRNWSQSGQWQQQFDTANSQWGQEFGWTQSSFAQELGLKYDTLRSNEALTTAGILSGEKIAGMNISSDERIAGLQIASAEKLAADSNFLTQQGIDLNRASQYGYTDANGNHVDGSMEIAGKRLNLDTYQVQQTVDLAQQYFGLDQDKFAEAQRSAQAMEGLQGRALDDAKEEFRQTFGLSERQFTEQNRQWQESFEQSKTEFTASNDIAQQQLGLNRDQLSEAIRAAQASEGLQGTALDDARNQFEQTFGLSLDEFEVRNEQWDAQFAESHNQWQASFDEGHFQFLSNLDMEQQELEFARWNAAQTLGLQERAMDITEQSAESDQYWDASEQFATFASTHIDATDAQIFDEAASWYEAKFGVAPDKTSAAYQTWARGEYAAATDGRLTNSYDAQLYSIDSSDLPDETKAMLRTMLTDPGIIQAAAGLEDTTSPDSVLAAAAADPSDLRGGMLPTSSNHSVWQSTFDAAPEWTPAKQTSSEGAGRTVVWTNAPAKNSVIRYKGMLVKVLTAATTDRALGVNVQEMQLQDLNTGRTFTIKT